MLSYPLAEASALLADKLVAAQLALANLIEDVEFLKEQITIMEVNTARVYNFDVKRLVLFLISHISRNALVGGEKKVEGRRRRNAGARTNERANDEGEKKVQADFLVLTLTGNRRRERKELEAKEKEAGGLLRNERDEEEEDEEEKD